MSTQPEAIQQALEALENVRRFLYGLDDDITALRAALAEQKCPCGDRPAEQCLGEWEPGCDMGSNPKYAKVAEHTPQQKVQEPVAWAYQWKQGNPISWYVTVARWPESDIWHEYPLYTAPQQAEPVQKPKRTVTYVCPVCAASLEKQP